METQIKRRNKNSKKFIKWSSNMKRKEDKMCYFENGLRVWKGVEVLGSNVIRRWISDRGRWCRVLIIHTRIKGRSARGPHNFGYLLRPLRRHWKSVVERSECHFPFPLFFFLKQRLMRDECEKMRKNQSTVLWFIEVEKTPVLVLYREKLSELEERLFWPSSSMGCKDVLVLKPDPKYYHIHNAWAWYPCWSCKL